MEGQFFTVYEVADKLRVCPHTIRKAIKKGRIHACRPGIGIKAPYRIHESELVRILMVDFPTILKERNEEK